MARVKDLWFSEVKGPDGTKVKQKTKRHPDNGGSKDAKRWLACWIGPDGKEKTKAFRILDAAKKYARKQEEDVERGEYVDPDAGKQLLGPLAKKWLRLRDVGLTSYERYEGVIRLHIEPAFGHRQVKSIRPSEIAEWLRDLARVRGISVQDQALFILRGVFALAVADGVRKDNPATSDIIGKPGGRQDGGEARTVWTADRAWSVICAHPDRYRLIPTLQAGCGMRESEAFAIAEDDFDFDAGKVHIRRQITRTRLGWAFKLPKGGKTRVAPLSPGVARAAQTFLEQHPARPYALPWLREDGTAADEHVCKLLHRWQSTDPRTDDQHVREWAYKRRAWIPALVAAGVIPEPEKGPRGGAGKHQLDRQDGTHALRHFYSTTLQDAGVSLAGVMEFLGHSRKGARMPITIGVYGHVTEETFEAARIAVDRSLFRLRAMQDQRAAGTGAEQAVSR